MKGTTWFLQFVTVFLCFILNSQAKNLTVEARLLSQLTDGYDPRARPRLDPANSVDVTFSFYLTRLDELNMRSEMLSVTGWLIIRWRDELLTWNPAEHGDITKLIIPTSSVWIPIIALDNSVDNIIEKKLRDNFYVIVSHTGLVSWEPAGTFATSCEIDLSFYPFDHQSCVLYFSTWDYSLNYVNLTRGSKTVNMDAYVENGEWDIADTEISVGSFTYACCPDEIFPEVVVTIHMSRRSLYYFINILIPCLMMSCLVLVVFYLPPDSGEKVSLGVTVLLAFSVFQLMIAEDMPTSANATPILEVYLLCFMAASIFSVIISVMVLNLHHRTEYTHPPRWLSHLFLHVLGHWLWMGTRGRCNAIHPLIVNEPEAEEKVETKVEIGSNTETYGGGQSFPKIVLPNSPAESSEELPAPTLLATSCQNLTAGAAKSAVRLIHSIANLDRNSKTESKVAFLSAVREVYEELYQSRKAGEVEAALENEWKLIARVVDRCFFWLTFILLIVSSAIIFGVIPNHDKHWMEKHSNTSSFSR